MASPTFPAPVPAAVVPALAARRRGRRLPARRTFAFVLAFLTAFSLPGYAGLSFYMALKLTTPVRREITRTPDQYGLSYDTVRFSSRDDALNLEGWLVKPAASAPPTPPATATPPHLRPVIL